MPLDVTPHEAAGMVQGPDGTWGFPDTVVQPTAGNTAVIDVGHSYSPGAAPGAPGSELAPSLVGTPGQGEGAAPTSDLEATMARLRQEVGGAPAGPTTGEATFGKGSSSAPKAAKPPAPHVAAGMVQAPDGTWGFPDTVQAQPEEKTAVPHSVETQELRNQPWYQGLIDTVKGVTETAKHGATFGLSDLVDPIAPALVHSIHEGIPFTQAYKLAQEAQRQPREQFQEEHPLAATGVSVAAGIPATVAAGPLFGSVATGAPAMARTLNAMRNIGASIGLGGVTGATMTDGDLETRLQGAKQGALLGGGLGIAAPALESGARAIGTAVAPFVSPTRTAERQVGNLLNEQANVGAGTPAPPAPTTQQPGQAFAGPRPPPATPGAAAVPTMTPSPIPGMPLNVAQASGNPELATLVDTHNASHVAAMKREQSAQNQAMLRHLPGSPAGSVPETTAARTSTAATTNIRQAQELMSREERRLWNTPALNRPAVTTQTSQDLVNAEIARMQRDQPGLADAYDHSPLASVVRDLNAMPEHASANEINSVRSNMLKVLRNPSVDGNVKVVARRLADLAAQGLDQAPEVIGAPARVVPPGWEHRNGQMTWTNGYTVPAIPPDPAIRNDLARARAFTRREAEIMGHASFDAILKRNSAGNTSVTPGTALNRFFDFANGVERPGAIRNVSDFLDDIRTEWTRLNQPGAYDPAEVARVQQDLVSNSRDFIIAKMLGRVSGVEQDLAGDRKIQAAQLRKWLNTNRPMLQRSGMFDANQLAALDQVGQAADLIQRGVESGRPIGSPTFTRLTGNNFLEAFIPGDFNRLASRAMVGGIIGATLGNLVGETALGAILGAGAEGTGIGAQVLNRIYSVPRARVLGLLDQAIRDPTIARDLMQRASQANAARWSPQTLAWVHSFLAAEPAGQAMRQFGPGKLGVVGAP